VLLWLVAAVAATLVGMTAVAAIGTDIFGGGQDPLSESEVDDLLSSRPPAAPTTTTASPPPVTSSQPPAPQQVQTDTAGGTVISRCAANGLVEVLSAVPAQGFQLDSDNGELGELDDHPSVKFRAGKQKIEVRLRCVNGVPVPTVTEDD
jgi:hypothetical protein